MEKYDWSRQAADDKIGLIRRISFACWITKATGTHSDYVILTAFPRQQNFRERASMLRVYVYCLSCLMLKSVVRMFWMVNVIMKTLPCVTCNSTSSQQLQRLEREGRTLQPNINLQAPCVLYLGQAFHYSPENAFYIFNQQIYFIMWYLLDRASLI